MTHADPKTAIDWGARRQPYSPNALWISYPSAEAIAGQSERSDLYTRITHLPFPGGKLLRTPALVAGMLWFRLRDML